LWSMNMKRTKATIMDINTNRLASRTFLLTGLSFIFNSPYIISYFLVVLNFLEELY
jgi:hypothetical protein